MTGSLRGFGLVELMVAMLLGLTLVLALVQYLASSRQTWLWQQQSARMQEDARYVLGRLSRDLRASGSYGCLDLEQALPGGLPEVLASLPNTIKVSLVPETEEDRARREQKQRDELGI